MFLAINHQKYIHTNDSLVKNICSIYFLIHQKDKIRQCSLSIILHNWLFDDKLFSSAMSAVPFWPSPLLKCKLKLVDTFYV